MCRSSTTHRFLISQIQSQMAKPKRAQWFRVFVINNRCLNFESLVQLSLHIILISFFEQVKKAFFALVANGVRAAPLWDSEKQSFVGKKIHFLVSFVIIVFRGAGNLGT